MRAQSDLVVEVNIGIFVPFMTGESGAHKAFRQTRHLRNMNRTSIQPGSATLFRGEHLIPAWVIKDPRDALAFVVQRNRNAEDGIAMSEIRRAIERIDVPAEVAAGFDSAALFAHEVVAWPHFANARDNQLL